jgi:integrase
MRLKLDTRAIAGVTLDEGERERFCWDESLPGFGLKLWRKRDGSILRTFVAQYRAAGRTRRHSLGATAKVSLTAAREAAKRILGGAALGHDPAGEKRAKRVQAARTFSAVADAYLAAAASRLRPGSLRLGKLYLLGDYFTPLFGTPVDQITRADVAACLSAAARRHSDNSAASARRWASTLFGWCIEEGLLLTGNPADGTRKPQRTPARDRVLSDQELRAIWNACGDDRDLSTVDKSNLFPAKFREQTSGGDYAAIVRLLILTGARRQEVGGLCWSELDLDAGTWTLPSARSKNHRSHCITLPPAALDIIRSVPKRACDELFGSLWGSRRGFQLWGRSKAALDARLKKTSPSVTSFQPWRLHDLRRTVATRMADIGIEPHVVEATLNHHSGFRSGVAGTYNRSSYAPQIASALTRWASHVAALIAGPNVIALAARI